MTYVSAGTTGWTWRCIFKIGGLAYYTRKPNTPGAADHYLAVFVFINDHLMGPYTLVMQIYKIVVA